jgi:ribosome-binding protein aMBF1 (putative translation factor)
VDDVLKLVDRGAAPVREGRILLDQKAGLSLAVIAARLGARSLNAYARYEQGRMKPSVQKLSELLSAVVPDRDFVLVESPTRD